MKITRIGPSFPLLTASTLGGSGGPLTPSVGSGLVPISTGSNSWAWGSNVQWITSNGSNVLAGPFVNFASGSNVTFAVASNTLTISSTGGASGDFVTTTAGGGEILSTVAASGATETIDLANGNVHDITLTANCTFTFTAPAAGRARSFTLVLRQDGTGSRLATWPGSVVWSGGVAPTLATAASSVDVLTFFTLDGGTVWYGFPTGGGSGDPSPLTTKGDLYTYSTVDARLAVGSNGTIPVADSNQTVGIRWTTQAISGELLISDTPAGSPLVFGDLLQNEAQDDLLYGDL